MYFDRALTAVDVAPELALADLDKAIRLAPDSRVRFRQVQGTALNNLKRHVEAEAVFTSVIAELENLDRSTRTADSTSRLANAYLERGVARFNGGDRPGGEKDVRKALVILPGDPRASGMLEQMEKFSHR